MQYTDDEFTREHLKELRLSLGLTQGRMGLLMGLPFRSYQDIEMGRVTFRPIHKVALTLGIIKLAVRRRDPNILPNYIKNKILTLKQIIDRTRNNEDIT